MLKARKGFTLIELLIVIVIIGILAAIAIPKFGKTREKAYFKAMMSDLRNLQSQQELYYSLPTSGYNYAASVGLLTDLNLSSGVTAAVVAGGSQGWSATAAHAALASTQFCGVIIGEAAALTAAGATVAGVIACTGEN
jgi:type IV pilus assembly protein PilA